MHQRRRRGDGIAQVLVADAAVRNFGECISLTRVCMYTVALLVIVITFRPSITEGLFGQPKQPDSLRQRFEAQGLRVRWQLTLGDHLRSLSGASSDALRLDADFEALSIMDAEQLRKEGEARRADIQALTGRVEKLAAEFQAADELERHQNSLALVTTHQLFTGLNEALNRTQALTENYEKSRAEIEFLISVVQQLSNAHQTTKESLHKEAASIRQDSDNNYVRMAEGFAKLSAAYQNLRDEMETLQTEGERNRENVDSINDELAELSEAQEVFKKHYQTTVQLLLQTLKRQFDQIDRQTRDLADEIDKLKASDSIQNHQFKILRIAVVVLLLITFFGLWALDAYSRRHRAYRHGFAAERGCMCRSSGQNKKRRNSEPITCNYLGEAADSE